MKGDLIKGKRARKDRHLLTEKEGRDINRLATYRKIAESNLTHPQGNMAGKPRPNKCAQTGRLILKKNKSVKSLKGS